MARVPFPIKFGGGLNNRDADFDIRDDQASAMSNVVYDETRAVETRDGYATYGDDLGSNACVGAGRYYYNNGTGSITYNLFEVVNTDLYLYVAATWTAQGRALTAGTPGMFVEAENEGYWFNGVDAVQNVANTTWSSLASGTPMSGANNIGRYAVYHKGMMYVAGLNSAPNTVYVSGDANDSLNTPETFTGGWAYIVGRGSKGKIIGMKVLRDYVVVFQEYGISMLSGPTGSTQNTIEVDGYVGACSQRSIASDGQYLYFQAMNGHVYSFDTTNVVKQSEIIQATIDTVNTAQLSKSNAEVFDYKGRKYILNFANGSSTTPDRTIVLDLERSVIASEDYNDKVWLPWSGLRSSVMIKYSANGTDEDLYFGEATADSKFYLMFSGTSDNGTAISSSYETKNFSMDQVERDKKFKYLYISARASGAWDLNVSYSTDGGSYAGTTPSTVDLSSSAPTFPMTFPITFSEGFLAENNTVVLPSQARFVKLKFSISTLDQYFKLYSATLMFRFGKLRKRIAAT